MMIWLHVASKNVAFLFFRRFRKWRDQQISIDGYELPTANEITEFELDSESKIEDDEDNFEVTDSCSSSKNESCD